MRRGSGPDGLPNPWTRNEADAAGLSTTLGRSTMTLGGLLKHLAYVEDHWFGAVLRGDNPQPPWDTVDWDADEDWGWSSASADSPGDLRALWSAAVDRSRELTSRALAAGGLEQHAKRQAHGAPVNLRWILTHLVEEYSRHNGHADLLRENVDGQTGE